MQVARGVDPMTHLQFVDDNFLMGEACIREAKCMKFVLENYSKVTGKCINWQKSEIFFFNTARKIQTRLCQILGVRQRLLPIKNLNKPLFQGKNYANLWKELIENCIKCLDGWKGRWLSFVGRIFLLQTIISAIPTFSMSCLKIPMEVLKYIE